MLCPALQADPEIQPLGEGIGLLLGSAGGSSVGVGGLPPLPDGPSSEFDDGVSLSSAGTASTASGPGDAGTALLRAAFLKDQYRGALARRAGAGRAGPTGNAAAGQHEQLTLGVCLVEKHCRDDTLESCALGGAALAARLQARLPCRRWLWGPHSQPGRAPCASDIAAIWLSVESCVSTCLPAPPCAGDDVKPFFYIGPQVLATSPSRKVEDLEEVQEGGSDGARPAAAEGEHPHTPGAWWWRQSPAGPRAGIPHDSCCTSMPACVCGGRGRAGMPAPAPCFGAHACLPAGACLQEAGDSARLPCIPLPRCTAEAIPHRLVKKRAINHWGTFVFLFFLGAFGFYVWARATHTLGLGSMLW